MRVLENGLIEVLGDDDYSDDLIFGDGLHEMTEAEHMSYARQVKESDGFDVEELPKVFAFGLIQPGDIDDEIRDLTAQYGIPLYNKENQGTSLELVDAVKVMEQVSCPFNFYITFTAKDTSTNEVNTYETKVVCRCPEDQTYAEFTRVKRGTQTQGPSETETKGRREREDDDDDDDEEKQGKRLKS